MSLDTNSTNLHEFVLIRAIRVSGFRACALACFLCPLLARAQFVNPDLVSSRSSSGQFIVSAPRRSTNSRLMSELETNRDYVRLDAMVLPASCERIKQALGRDLDLTAPWQGRIFFSIQSAHSPEDQITVLSDRFSSAWQFQVSMPEIVQRGRYVRALVQAILQEIANRNGAERSAELPTWLIEGLSRRLLASNELEIILPAPRAAPNGFRLSTTTADEQIKSALEKVHTELCEHTPLSFEELSWPTAAQLEGEGAELYGCCAQLFVNQLLALPQGRACLRAMLDGLAGRYNWQLAFMDAFRAVFNGPRELEKWWALQLARFTGRELAQTWPAQESWQNLDQVLLVPLEVRVSTNDAPFRTEVSLQTLISHWQTEPQKPVIQTKVHDLDAFRFEAARDQLPFIDEYRRVLENYLRNRDKRGMLGLLPFHRKSVRRQAAEAAITKLELLDARKLALEYIRESLVPAQAQTGQAQQP